MEALDIFGLTNPTDQTNAFIKNGVAVLISALLVFIFFRYRSTQIMLQPLCMIMVACFFLIFLGLARFLVMGNAVWPYLFPLAAFGLTIGIIFNFELAAILSLILAFLSVLGFGREAELIIFYLVPGLVAMFILGDARRLSTFFGTGFVSGVIAALIVAMFRLGDSYTDWLGLGTLMAAALFNGIATATLALLLQHIFASILDLPTSLQLMDISRPDHPPLLQLLLNNAPGTYQHSLQVSNLAEQAADAIGANRLLVRAGTLFHDIGKSSNASFFIENQIRGAILTPTTRVTPTKQHKPSSRTSPMALPWRNVIVYPVALSTLSLNITATTSPVINTQELLNSPMVTKVWWIKTNSVILALHHNRAKLPS